MRERIELGVEMGWIYFIQRGAALKVGWARNPNKRLNELQVGSPWRLSLIGVVPGSQEDEKKLHRRFAAARISGEWFRRRDIIGEVRRLISELGLKTVFVGKSRNIPGKKPQGKYCVLVPKYLGA
jgi:hypothetical protein